MDEKSLNPLSIKKFTSNFIFKDSCNFLLDYNGFKLADNKNTEGKFIKISFSEGKKPGPKQCSFRCFYKMVGDFFQSLN